MLAADVRILKNTSTQFHIGLLHNMKPSSKQVDFLRWNAHSFCIIICILRSLVQRLLPGWPEESWFDHQQNLILPLKIKRFIFLLLAAGIPIVSDCLLTLQPILNVILDSQ